MGVWAVLGGAFSQLDLRRPAWKAASQRTSKIYDKLISQLLMAVCPHVIHEKLASCHILVVLVLLLQSFLPLPLNISSPSSGFPEKMTGFPAQGGER